MIKSQLTSLVAAVHTPFHSDGSLKLAGVEQQAAHLLAQKVTFAFVGGTTGESHSLSVEERCSLARALERCRAGNVAADRDPRGSELPRGRPRARWTR